MAKGKAKVPSNQMNGGDVMNHIEIKVAQKEDIAKLVEIQIESFHTAFADIISKETLQKHADIDTCTNMLHCVFDAEKGTFYMAYLNGEPCGELFWCNGDEDNPESAEIVAVHSLKKTWGSGIGKAMMERACKDISMAGKTQVYLWVFKENARACRFYEKCGFSKDGKEQITRFDSAIEIRYVKQL